MKELTSFQEEVLFNLKLNGYGFNYEKHVPFFVEFIRGNGTNRRYVYYIPLSELTNSIVKNPEEIIGEYVVVPVGTSEFAVAKITHTINTITSKHFDPDVIINHIDNGFIIRPILVCIGDEQDDTTPIGAYFEFMRKEKEKVKLEAMINKRLEESRKIREMNELAEHDPKLKEMLKEYKG